MTSYTQFDSPLGRMLVTASPAAITGVYFDRQKHFPDIARDWVRDGSSPLLTQARRELSEYFSGTRTAFDLPVEPGGTPFQRRVWQALRTIPFGETRTYRALAERLGAPEASRAVGAAVGRNPLSVVVPCHRVIGANGSLTGYAGGLDRKRALLKLEGETRT